MNPIAALALAALALPLVGLPSRVAASEGEDSGSGYSEEQWRELREGKVLEERSREGRTIRSSIAALLDASPDEFLSIAGMPCERPPEHKGPPPRALDKKEALEVLATEPKNASSFESVATKTCILSRDSREVITLTEIPLPFPLSDSWLLARMTLEEVSTDRWVMRLETLAGGLGDFSGIISARRLEDGRLLHEASTTTTITLPVPSFLLDRHDKNAAQARIDRARERLREARAARVRSDPAP